MDYTIKMPVKPHLKKFILYYYNFTEPIPARRDDKLGIILYSILNRDYINWKPNHWNRPKENLIFSLSEDYAKRSGVVITAYNHSLFNNWVDSEFRFLLYSRIDDKIQGVEPKIGFYKSEIKTFLKKYKIEQDDISIDAIVKDLYRRRMQNNLGDNCPFELRRFNTALKSNL